MIKILVLVLSLAISSPVFAQAQILPHPAGCPRVAFCGCGAAVDVFKAPRRDLWQARAWFKFPRSSPSSGMVAVRRGHVFVLRQHIRDSIWLVYDANSGGRKTRLHERSISGWTIVNPLASSFAESRN